MCTVRLKDEQERISKKSKPNTHKSLSFAVQIQHFKPEKVYKTKFREEEDEQYTIVCLEEQKIREKKN